MKSKLLVLVLLVVSIMAYGAPKTVGTDSLSSPSFRVGNVDDVDVNSLMRNARRNPAVKSSQKSLPAATVTKGAAADDPFYFYGQLEHSDNWDVMTDGMYRLTPYQQPELSFPFAGMDWTFETVSLYWGWIDNGLLHAANIVETMGNIFVYEIYTVDMATRKVVEMDDVLQEIEAGVAGIQCFLEVAAYNPNDGYIYGYGPSSDGAAYAFTRASADHVGDAEMIKRLDWTRFSERCFALCYNLEENAFYGINNAGYLVRIDMEGNQTEICKAPLGYKLNKSTSGMVMDYDHNCLYVNLVDNTSYSSSLYRYDFSTGEFEMALPFDYNNAFLSFFSSLDLDNPNLPERPEFISESFIEDSLSGDFLFRMPSTWADGTPMDGKLTLKASIDGDEFFSSDYSCGEEVAVNVNAATGFHEIKVVVVKDGAASRPFFNRRWYGNDNPCTPKFKGFENGVLSWYPVSEGAHNGYMDANTVVYNVYLDGVAVAGSPVKETEISVALPEDEPYSAHFFEVVAEAAGMRSEPMETDPIIVGKPWQPNVLFAPTKSQALAFTRLRMDEELDPEWSVETMEDGSIWFNSGFNNWDPMSNMIVTPPISLDDTDNYYNFSVDAAIAEFYGEEEKFEVWIGKAPTYAALDRMVMNAVHPVKEWVEGGETFSNNFSVDEPGVYYIGIKCVSPMMQAGVMVRNISISKTSQSMSGPASLENIEVVPAEKGELSADVSFNFPTKKANGDSLDSDLTLTAIVSCVNSVEVTGHPGERASVKVMTKQGDNIINTLCRLDDMESPVGNVTVYTGVDIPMHITDMKMKVTEDGRGVELSWTPPTEGVNGGYINPDELYYRINCSQYYEYVYEAVDHYTYYLPEDAKQKFYHVFVVPCSAAGSPSEFEDDAAIIGTPYPLPATEHFTGNELEYSPVVVESGAWYVNDPARVVTNTECEDGSALILLGSEGAGKVALPLFSTEGEGVPTISATIFNHETLTPTVTVLGHTRDMKNDEWIGSFNCEGTGWTVATIALPEKFRNQKWISLYLFADINENQALLIDEYSLAMTSGVNGMEQCTFSVSTVDGGINVIGAQGEVKAYSLDGIMVAKTAVAMDKTFIPLAPGCYVIAVNNKTLKVLVK